MTSVALLLHPLVARPPLARAVPPPSDIILGAGATLSVTVDDDGTHLALRSATRTLDVWDVPARLADVTSEPSSSAGRDVVLVRGRGAPHEVVAIVDLRPRPHFVWRGRLDLHGDPGERVADVLEVRDIDGDARSDLVVGQRRDGVSACGQPPQLLFARALDARGALRAVQPIVAAAAHVLEAVPAEPGPLRAPIVSALRFTVASSARGQEEDAALLGPPFGLTDGDLATGWSEGRGAGGDGEVLRAQWAGPAITEFVIVSASAESMPRGVRLRLDDVEHEVSIPPAAGDRARIVLPTPTRPACVSVVIADRTARAADAQLGFVEIVAYSVVDADAGLAGLVDVLVADGREGDRAVGWLAAAGPRSLPVLDESWERLGARGRRRALRVASALERAPDPSVVAAVRALRVRAGGDEDVEVRADAIAALARGDDADRSALFELARAEPSSSPLAAVALARSAGLPSGAVPTIVALEPTHWDRPAMRLAIARAVAREPELRASLEAMPLDAYALAALSLGLADARSAGVLDASTDQIVIRLLRRALGAQPPAEPFVTRFRIARAAREVEDAELDRWLDATAREAEEWMLRAECVTSLGPRASRELLAIVLHDPAPRVRLAGARAVAQRGGERATLLARARHDAWPLVRAYALGEIVDTEPGRAAAIDALRDPASAMRARALELLRTRTGPDLDAHVAAILDDTAEWPHVTARAIEVAEARCSPALGPSLVRLVARGARAGASASDLESAQLALRVALRFGDQTATAAREAARGPAAQVFEPLLARVPEACAASAPEAARTGVPSPS